MFGFFGALLGAQAVAVFPAEPLRKALPFVLLFLLFYTWFQPALGGNHQPSKGHFLNQLKAATMGLGIGFYDGFFGPGAGSFLLFAFVRLFSFDFLHAAAATKLVNVATNLAAIAMMVANIAGSQYGSKLAIRHGSTFVRKTFLIVVSALIAKSAYDAFFSN